MLPLFLQKNEHFLSHNGWFRIYPVPAASIVSL